MADKPKMTAEQANDPQDAARLYSEERNAGKSPAEARAFVEAGGALTPAEAEAIEAHERSRYDQRRVDL